MMNPLFYIFKAVCHGLLANVHTVIEEPSGARTTVCEYVVTLYGVPGTSFPGSFGSLAMLVALGSAIAMVSLVSARRSRA